MKSTKKPKQTKTNPVKHRPAIFASVGVGLTLFDYITYILLTTFVLANLSNSHSIAVAISGTLATIAAYIAHRHITWRDRHITRLTIVKFLIVNIFAVLILRPFSAILFAEFTPLYQFAYNISSALSLPFTHEFIISTGIFGFATLTMLVFHYFAYSHFVFPKSSEKPKR
ncbi:GtrA family protein [Candidatus Saccharibacteria bacterium]|nr:GtrA family protein [Candidatus Saccharibacteria bacterium]